MHRELQQLKMYLTKDASENAKDHLVFPFFQKLFRSDKFKRESDASGADMYIEGRLVVELKTKEEDWINGFFQALHYNKKGLSFSAISVISYKFIGLWRLDDLPGEINSIIAGSDPKKSANEIGRINANKCSKALKKQILSSASFLFEKEQTLFTEDVNTQLLEYEDRLRNLDVLRNQINPGNFLRKIGLLKTFFEKPLDAIHCFYTILPYWDITSRVPEPPASEQNRLWINCQNGTKASERLLIDPKNHKNFRKFVESHYVFTNDEEGLSVDYYFSRFDEALAEHDPDYVKQHGIFFTDINLSRFALWFIREKFGEKKLSDKYIVIDPAGGSGNLVSSWKRNHLKFKIISELNPDLLKTIELRLRSDPVQLNQGFSIIPKTHENKGLNFIDKTAEQYYEILETYLKTEGKKIDKPFAFLLNPPYKNTDENEDVRTKTEADYGLDPSIILLTGKDAGNERYLAFLAQILLLCKLQKTKMPSLEPALMIFTPTSWLIPRPTYKGFREIFDTHFKFEKGFMVTGKEFFKGTGRWPVAFTIWKFNERKNTNKVKLLDLTDLQAEAFSNVNWNENLEKINAGIRKIIRGKKEVLFDESRQDIRQDLPLIEKSSNKKLVQQPRYDYSHAKRKADYGKTVSGFPLKDTKRHYDLKRKCGEVNGEYVGFYDDNTPVRVTQDNYSRISKKPDRIWFRLDNVFININQTRLLNGPPDKYGFCAYDLFSAELTLSWFALTKALNGIYPAWANQFNIWSPSITKKHEKEYYSLCFAFALSENRCIVTKFEKDNPVAGAPEIFVDNPMCPANPESFWSTTLDAEVTDPLALKLVNSVKEIYRHWNVEYCKGQFLENVGLHEEPYFKYFDYPDFVTPYSGLIQLRRYAEINGRSDLTEKFETIRELTRQVKERIYHLLVQEFNYFE